MACCRDPVTFHAELGAANFACGRVQMWEQQRVLHRSCRAQLAIRAERNTIAALAIATRLWILGPEFAADVTIRCRCVARFRRRQHPARKRKARLVAGLNLSTISAVEYRVAIGPPDSCLPPTGSCKTDFTKTTAHSCSKGVTIRYSRWVQLRLKHDV